MCTKTKYFVLKPEGNDPYAKASRQAMIAYAESICAYNWNLADALWEWINCELDQKQEDKREATNSGDIKTIAATWAVRHPEQDWILLTADEKIAFAYSLGFEDGNNYAFEPYEHQ